MVVKKRAELKILLLMEWIIAFVVVVAAMPKNRNKVKTMNQVHRKGQDKGMAGLMTLAVVFWMLTSVALLPLSFGQSFPASKVFQQSLLDLGSFGKIIPLHPQAAFMVKGFLPQIAMLVIILVFMLAMSMILLKQKKAMLFTVALTLLVLVVLSLAVLIDHFNQAADDRAAEIGVVDRLSNLDTSLSSSISWIVLNKSGISFTVEPGSIIIEELLPNPAKTTFASTLTTFKNFVENNDNFTSLNITNATATLPFIFLPYNMTYAHNGFGGQSLNFTSGNASITDYSITIFTGGVNASMPSPCSLDTGSLGFTINTADSQGNGFSCQNQLNPQGAYSFTITTSNGTISVEMYSPASVMITNAATFNARVTLQGEFAQPTFDHVSVLLDTTMILISFPEFQVLKKGRPTIID